MTARTKSLIVKLTPDEHQLLRRLAADSGTSISGLVRTRLLGSQADSLPPVPAGVDEGRRNKRRKLTLTEQQDDYFVSIAELLNLSVPRTILRLALNRRLDLRFHRALLLALSRQGNNLNQLAKRANTDGFAHVAKDIYAVLTQLQDLLDALATR